MLRDKCKIGCSILFEVWTLICPAFVTHLALAVKESVMYLFDIPSKTWRALDSSVGVDTDVGSTPSVNYNFGMAIVGVRIFIYGGERNGESSYLFLRELLERALISSGSCQATDALVCSLHCLADHEVAAAKSVRLALVYALTCRCVVCTTALLVTPLVRVLARRP